MVASAEQAAGAILRSAAPGHFDAVAKEIQVVGKSTLTSDKWLKEITKEQKVFECKGIHKSPQDLKHPLAEPLYKLLQDYQTKNFGGKSGVQSRVALTKGTKGPQQLVVHSFCEKLDGSNQNSGCWKATWTVDKVSNNSSSCEVSGSVLVHTYSHEEGNVQLRINKDFPVEKVTAGSKDAAPTGSTTTTLEQAVLQTIVTWETEILGILASMNTVAAQQLRTIRRVLPITKTKMKWDVVAHRSVKTLKETAPETRAKVKYGKDKQ